MNTTGIARAQQTLSVSWREHVRAHPLVAGGLAIGVLAVCFLLAESLATLNAGGPSRALVLTLYGGTAGFLATSLGASPALLLRTMPQRLADTLMGMVAGMMLAATAFSLLLPGIDAGTHILGNAPLGACIVVLGMALGVLLMLGLEQFTPHEHESTGPCGPGYTHYPRMWLFVFAIALHNLPEGMAIGVAFSQGSLQTGLPLAVAIALQDIPEGLAVALALRSVGLRPARAVMLAALSGVPEPLGALVGLGLASGFPLAYPIGMGLAAGAMLFVISHEVIPETHRNGHQTPATLGLMAGFAVMMVLDTTLG